MLCYALPFYTHVVILVEESTSGDPEVVEAGVIPLEVAWGVLKTLEVEERKKNGKAAQKLYIRILVGLKKIVTVRAKVKNT